MRLDQGSVTWVLAAALGLTPLGACNARQGATSAPLPAPSNSVGEAQSAMNAVAVMPSVQARSDSTLSESQSAALVLADDVLAWLQRYRATFVESNLAAHAAFYDTDEFVEIRLLPDGPRRRTWRDLQSERAQQVSAAAHAGSAVFENAQVLDWQFAPPSAESPATQTVRLFFAQRLRYLSQPNAAVPGSDLDEFARVTMTVKRWHEGPGGFRIVEAQLADVSVTGDPRADESAPFEPSTHALQEVVWAPRTAICEPKRSECERPGELLLLTTDQDVRVLSIPAALGDAFVRDEQTGWLARRDHEVEIGWGVTSSGALEVGQRSGTLLGRFEVLQSVSFAPVNQAVSMSCLERDGRSKRACLAELPHLPPQAMGQAERDATRRRALLALEVEAKAVMQRWFDARQRRDVDGYVELYDEGACAADPGAMPPTPSRDGKWLPIEIDAANVRYAVTSESVLVEMPELALVLARRGRTLKVVSGCEWQEQGRSELTPVRPGIDFALLKHQAGRTFVVLQQAFVPPSPTAIATPLDDANTFTAVTRSSVPVPLRWLERGVRLVNAAGACDGTLLGFGVLTTQSEIEGEFEALVAEIAAPCVGIVALPPDWQGQAWREGPLAPEPAGLALRRYRSSVTYARFQHLVGERSFESGPWDVLDSHAPKLSLFQGPQRSFVLVAEQQGDRCDGDYANLWAVYEVVGQRLRRHGEVGDPEARSRQTDVFEPALVLDVDADGFPEFFTPFQAASLTGKGYAITLDIIPGLGFELCCR